MPRSCFCGAEFHIGKPTVLKLLYHAEQPSCSSCGKGFEDASTWICLDPNGTGRADTRCSKTCAQTISWREELLQTNQELRLWHKNLYLAEKSLKTSKVEEVQVSNFKFEPKCSNGCNGFHELPCGIKAICSTCGTRANKVLVRYSNVLCTSCAENRARNEYTTLQEQILKQKAEEILKKEAEEKKRFDAMPPESKRFLLIELD